MTFMGTFFFPFLSFGKKEFHSEGTWLYLILLLWSASKREVSGAGCFCSSAKLSLLDPLFCDRQRDDDNDEDDDGFQINLALLYCC